MSTVDAPAAKPVIKPKKKARKRQVRTKPEAPAATAAYPGLTETDCARACSQAGCVISGNLTCAHPRKGGLRGTDMNDPVALKRLQAAQKQIATTAAEKRFT